MFLSFPVGFGTTARNGCSRICLFLALTFANGVVLATIPAAPNALTVVAASATQLNLHWVDNSTDETSFKIERKVGAAGTYAQIATVGANIVSFPDTDLTPGTVYFYRVRAANKSGNSAYTNEASAVPTTPPTVQLTAPVDGAIATQQLGLIAAASDSDGTIANVTFHWMDNWSSLGQGAFVNGSLQLTQPPYSAVVNVDPSPDAELWSWPTYLVSAVATDNAGASTTSSVNVTIVPTVKVTSPATGAACTAPATIELAAEIISPNPNLTPPASSIVVGYYDGETLIGTAAEPPYTFTWHDVPAGPHSVTARISVMGTFVSSPVNVAVSTAERKMYFIEVDHLNVPRVASDAAGTVVWRWDPREPFGDDMPDGDPSGLGTFDLPLRMPGQYFDRETNLHYNYFRDYAPGIGRYQEGDPIGLEGGLNTYAYVENDPVWHADPFGLYKYADPSIPSVNNPQMDQFLQCLDGCTGREQIVTATSNGKHADPGHANGTTVDIRPTGTPSSKFFCCSGNCGAAYVLDERTRVTRFGTGPHYHVQLVPPSNPANNSASPSCRPTC